LFKNTTRSLLLFILLGGFLFPVCSDQVPDEKSAGVDTIQSANLTAAAFTALDVGSVFPEFEDWESYDPYRGGTIVAFLDSSHVTMEELQRFQRRFGSMTEVKHDDREKESAFMALPLYVRFFAGIKESKRLGLDRSPLFLKRFHIATALSLAMPHEKWLRESAVFDSERLKAAIPSEWLKMDFSLWSFKSEEDAKEGRKGVRTPEQFLEKAKRRGGVTDTGPIFPNSGFFDPWYEAELFDLSRGDIYGPVQTGIGWALVLVKSREEFTVEQMEQYIANQRDSLARSVAGETLSEYLAKRDFQIDSEALQNAIFREFSNRGFSDAAVATLDGESITYREFRVLSGKNYTNLKNLRPRTSWIRAVTSDLSSILQQYASGKMALESIASGQWQGPLPDVTVRVLYDYRKVFLYYALLDHISTDLIAKISDKEVKVFYMANKSSFTYGAKSSFIYVFNPSTEVADIWKKILSDGGGIDDAVNAVYSIGKGASPHGNMQYQRAELFEGDNSFEGIRDKILAMKEGQTSSIKGDMGYYLIKITDKVPSRIPPLEEVKSQVKELLVSQRLAEETGKLINSLSMQVKVKSAEGFEHLLIPSGEPKGVPDILNPDWG